MRKAFYVWMFLSVVSMSLAAIAPVTSVSIPNPNGTKPYMLQGITVGTYTVTGLVTGTTTSSPSVAQGNVDDFDLDTLSSGYTYPIQTVLFGSQNFVSANGGSPDFFLFEAGSGDPDDIAITPIFADGSLGTAVNLPTTVNPAGWGDTGYRMVSQQAGQWIMGISWDITDMKDAAGSNLSPSAAIKGIRITQISGGLDVCGFFAGNPAPISDLSDNGKVDMQDFGILSQGWKSIYEMPDLLKIAEDWLLTADAVFKFNPVVEIDAVTGTAYSSTLADDVVYYDVSQLFFSKVSGPAWLTVAADGALSGTPLAGNAGINAFTVRVEDGLGNGDQTILNIYVNAGGPGWVTIYPAEYPYALRNPLMGFRPNTSAGSTYSNEPYATVTRCYITWKEIENYESDTIDKIKTFCNNKWKDAEKYNVKVIPRVYLDWDGNPGNESWPADMTAGDYSSEQFKTRLRRLIQRLGQCWDTDPRVAWVQMGIIGWWGEQETPWPTAEIQQLMTEEFTAAFPNKKVLVRRPNDAFTAFPFGGYLDSWANWYKESSDGADADYLNTTQARWKVNVWEGESAYNCCGNEIQPGDSPDDTMKDPVHRNFMIDTIRKRHCSALGWVSGYTKSDPASAAGAEEVQRAFGYRYLLNEVKYPAMVTPGAAFSIQFTVTNAGSAPFYYNWPVEASLLNPTTKAVVIKGNFTSCDIRNWLPGDQYNSTTRTYSVPAVVNTVTGTFQLPTTGIPNGEYILALAILDPAGMLPSARFSTVNYFNGGRHPIGKIGVSVTPSQILLSPSIFNDIATDRSLYYVK